MRAKVRTAQARRQNPHLKVLQPCVSTEKPPRDIIVKLGHTAVLSDKRGGILFVGQHISISDTSISARLRIELCWQKQSVENSSETTPALASCL